MQGWSAGGRGTWQLRQVSALHTSQIRASIAKFEPVTISLILSLLPEHAPCMQPHPLVTSLAIKPAVHATARNESHTPRGCLIYHPSHVYHHTHAHSMPRHTYFREHIFCLIPKVKRQKSLSPTPPPPPPQQPNKDVHCQVSTSNCPPLILPLSTQIEQAYLHPIV